MDKPTTSKSAKSKRSVLPDIKLKVVVRRLPPNLPEPIFWDSVAPWVNDETTTWRTFNEGKVRKGVNKENLPSRAYINFKTPEQLAVFSKAYDGHLFRDKTGTESTAVVEYAPFQKVPTEKRKVDVRAGTINDDEDFKSFLASLDRNEPYVPQNDAEAIVGTEDPTTTPLLAALLAEKSAAKDKQAIIRAHAHYNSIDSSDGGTRRRIEIKQRAKESEREFSRTLAPPAEVSNSTTPTPGDKPSTPSAGVTSSPKKGKPKAPPSPARAAGKGKGTAAPGAEITTLRPPKFKFDSILGAATAGGGGASEGTSMPKSRSGAPVRIFQNDSSASPARPLGASGTATCAELATAAPIRKIKPQKAPREKPEGKLGTEAGIEQGVGKGRGPGEATPTILPRPVARIDDPEPDLNLPTSAPPVRGRGRGGSRGGRARGGRGRGGGGPPPSTTTGPNE